MHPNQALEHCGHRVRTSDVTKKNPRSPGTTDKISFRKYDPIARKHVAFKEAKIK